MHLNNKLQMSYDNYVLCILNYALKKSARHFGVFGVFCGSLIISVIRVFYGLPQKFSYYYRSFSCFFAKIFSMVWSFRMTSFAPREAMTTAEPPEPLYFSAYRIHYMQTNSSEDWRPGGEAFSVIRTTIVHFLVFLKRFSLKHRASA